MSQFLGRFKLRNVRLVHQDGANFKVVQIDSKGVEHSQQVSSQAVDHLHMICSGETVTSAEAAIRLAPYARSLGLPYQYGWKLECYVREMLLVLAATGRATLLKEGNRFLYQVE